jgi:integral membrane protein (TIGR01906 family)
MDALGTYSETSLAVRQILSWVVTLILPVFLVLLAIRLMLTPAFVQLEYNTPNFPPDPYGFTKQDRLYWAQTTLDYLNNSAGISFLGDLRFPDGQPFYNERELQHMEDVKTRVKQAMNVFYVSLGLLAALGIVSAITHSGGAFLKGLSRGGLLTIILLAAIMIFVLVAFNVIFVLFHEIFFTAGTWTFSFSDSLIRLFPERFWFNAFVAIGLLSVIPGLVLWLVFRHAKV